MASANGTKISTEDQTPSLVQPLEGVDENLVDFVNRHKIFG